MQKIVCIKSFKGYKEGEVYLINNNETHSLIENGYAKLYQEYTDKMMRPKIRRIK